MTEYENGFGGPKCVCGRIKFPKYVCLVAPLGEQLVEKQILKILDILWWNGINSYQYNTTWAMLFSNIIYRPKVCNFVKIRFWHKCFPVNVGKFLGTTFFTKHVRATDFGFSFVNPWKKSVKELV